jgi:LysR family carnitine catabolism transcriptional activator
MDLQQMRYALAVVDTGTFTAAGRACHVAQPSLSQSVRNLERELGVDLFHRIGRRVVVTAAGHAFADSARLALRAADAVRVEVSAVTGLLGGSLELVSLPTLALDPITPLVGAFCTAHPQVLVRLAHPDGTDDLVQSVQAGVSEVGITATATALAGRGLISHRLGRQELVAVLPPGSPQRATITAAAFARLPLVTNPVGTNTRSLLESLLGSAGVKPHIAVETDQREAVVPLVLAGAGAALLPRSMADAAALQDAVVLPFQPRLWRDLVLVHRDATLSPAARAFVAMSLSRSRSR